MTTPMNTLAMPGDQIRLVGYLAGLLGAVTGAVSNVSPVREPSLETVMGGGYYGTVVRSGDGRRSRVGQLSQDAALPADAAPARRADAECRGGST